jgi:L-aminopeptidase/D-esterase-like protein
VASTRLEMHGGLFGVAGCGVGSVSDRGRGTGVTVIVLPPHATGAAVISGGGPATRETDALRPDTLVSGPDAVVLAGGSAFGLAAADGVMAGLADRGRGVRVGRVRVPIVAAAAIFDRGAADGAAPGPADGGAALTLALRPGAQRVREGQYGAGTGATVGKFLGPQRAAPGGQGSVTAEWGGVRLAALCVVNAVGAVRSRSGRILAGPAGPAGPVDPREAPPGGTRPPAGRTHTTLAVVAVEASLSKAALARVALMAHDGLARAIDPVHTPWDGDAVFAVATGGDGADVGAAGTVAAWAVAEAVRRAVRRARGRPAARPG